MSIASLRGASEGSDVAISKNFPVIPDLIPAYAGTNPYNIDSRLRGNDKEEMVARNDKVIL